MPTHLPSAAAVGAAGHRVRQPRPEARLLLAGQLVERDQRTHQLEQALQQVDVDHLADARAQRHHRGEGADQPGHLVGQRDRRQQRLAVGLPAERGQPAHRFGDRGEPRPVRVRPVLTEPGDARDHQRWSAGEQHVGPEPEALERAGAEVLDEHVGLGDQAQEHLAVGVGLQIERDRPLVAVDELPPQAAAVAWVAPGHVAQRVTAVGSFDLDDVGAEVGEVAGAVRAGEHRREVERRAGRPAEGPAARRRSPARRPLGEASGRLDDVVGAAGVREAHEAVAASEVEVDPGCAGDRQLVEPALGTARSSRRSPCVRAASERRRTRRTRRRPRATSTRPAPASPSSSSRRLLAVAAHVAVELVLAVEGGETGHLRDGRGADEEVLLEALDGGGERRRRHDPAQPPAGHREVLREAVDDDRVRVVRRAPSRPGRRT